jgi:hypothetical protein
MLALAGKHLTLGSGHALEAFHCTADDDRETNIIARKGRGGEAAVEEEEDAV